MTEKCMQCGENSDAHGLNSKCRMFVSEAFVSPHMTEQEIRDNERDAMIEFLRLKAAEQKALIRDLRDELDAVGYAKSRAHEMAFRFVQTQLKANRHRKGEQ